MNIDNVLKELEESGNTVAFITKEALVAIREAVEKQIPKEVGTDEYGWNECPNHCTIGGLIKRNMRHCPHCGQALKWD